MFSRKTFLGIFGMMLVLSLVAVAQQPQQATSAPQEGLRRERMEGKERRREGLRGERKMRGEMRGHRGEFMRDLNLSDVQREQIRAITQRRLEATKSQREELFRMREKRIAGTFSTEDGARARALRDEIRSAMDGIRVETEGILTAEQKARAEQLRAERKARHQERLGDRKERHEQRLRLRQERVNRNPL